MEEKVIIKYLNKESEFEVLTGTENEKAIVINNLKSSLGLFTYDPGFKNTASTKSDITFIDGDKGVLRYRGYNIEELAENSSFVEIMYLLLEEKLPNAIELKEFENEILSHCNLDDNMKKIIEALPNSAHPMGVTATMISSLSAFYPDNQINAEEIKISIKRILGKIITIAAWSNKNSLNEELISPKLGLDYCSNFLHMMFSNKNTEYLADEVVLKAINKLFILHADHEQNCSTSSVRLVGSSETNIYSSITSGISALWGQLHGGANQEVIEMLINIMEDGGDIDKWINKAKDKNDPFRLMGFGHRVYKNFDPRAKILKEAADDILEKLNINDPLLSIAKKLEFVALNDEYFISRKLYPNVDFYSGIIYKALGIPINMFTVMFVIGRMPGWLTQWKEMVNEKPPISRPRQIYIGEKERSIKHSKVNN